MNNDEVRASRLPPAKVEPVTINGVRYSQVVGKNRSTARWAVCLGPTTPRANWSGRSRSARTAAIPGSRATCRTFFSSMSVDPDGRQRGDTYLGDVKTRSVSAGAKAKPAEDDADALVPPG